MVKEDSFKIIMSMLTSLKDPESVEGMKKFGINDKNTLGVSVTTLRKIAKRVVTNHELAEMLWNSEIHEARILAGLVDDPGKVTPKQMDKWANDFDSWDVCDQVCSNLFDKTEYAYQKAFEWSGSDKEFVKRAGYVLMACLSVHDETAEDIKFIGFFRIIRKGATDERNFVKKAVNWALRQIGKRNKKLNEMAIKEAEEINKIGSESAVWIASNALKELRSDAVQNRLDKKAKD
jgi:3-methyladenine DNA glycosylase AlkD